MYAKSDKNKQITKISLLIALPVSALWNAITEHAQLSYLPMKNVSSGFLKH